MGDPTPRSLTDVRVRRYAPDGGYSPGEWAKAFAGAELDSAAQDGSVTRLGAQITKTRIVDVLVRVERPGSVVSRVLAALGRSRSDRLFGNRSALRASVPGGVRALAVLSADLGGETVRLLIAQPAD